MTSKRKRFTLTWWSVIENKLQADAIIVWKFTMLQNVRSIACVFQLLWSIKHNCSFSTFWKNWFILFQVHSSGFKRVFVLFQPPCVMFHTMCRLLQSLNVGYYRSWMGFHVTAPTLLQWRLKNKKKNRTCFHDRKLFRQHRSNPKIKKWLF